MRQIRANGRTNASTRAGGDEQQRDRVRIFVKNESRKAAADLAWIESDVEQLVAQDRASGGAGRRPVR